MWGGTFTANFPVRIARVTGMSREAYMYATLEIVRPNRPSIPIA
jgi:hypothetical protein